MVTRERFLRFLDGAQRPKRMAEGGLTHVQRRRARRAEQGETAFSRALGLYPDVLMERAKGGLRSLIDAGSSFGRAYRGELDPMSDEAIQNMFDVAGAVTVGSGAFPADDTLRAGARIFDRSRLSEVPDVPQVDLPRVIPPRGVPARVQDVTTDRGVRDRMLETIQRGVDLGGANWYNAEPLRLEFVRELGEEKGNTAFARYMDLVAATSPRSDVGTNVRNASYYYSRDMQGEGAPEVGARNPQPYGHMAQRLHQMNVQRVLGEGWDSLKNPKPAAFAQNLIGNQRPATIDTHAFRLPAMLGRDERFLETAYQSGKETPKLNIQQMVGSGEISMDDALQRGAYWQAQPKANEYAAMERYYQGLGEELGLTPAQTQAAAWVGGGETTGLASDSTKPFIGFLEDRVMLTAEKADIDPREVLRRFIRGEMPLLSVGALGTLAAAGALPESDRPRTERAEE